MNAHYSCHCSMRWEQCIAGPPEDPCKHLPAARMGHVAVAVSAADSAWGEELFVLHGGISEDKRALRCGMGLT